MIVITIKKILFVSTVMLVLAAVTLSVSLYIVDGSVQVIKTAERVRHNSLLLSDELMESSRGLTSCVQKFVVTGDEAYADAYADILLTRSGKKPRGQDREIAPGQLISLHKLMVEAGFTDYELRLLSQAQELSDELAIYEIMAMNTARGLSADDNGEYTIEGKPNKSLAMSLIFNPDYEHEVSMIMEPFTEFANQLNERLGTAINNAQQDYDDSMRIVWIMLGAVALIFVIVLLMIGLLIVRPILICDSFAKQVAEGNLNSNLSYFSGNEIGSLASSLRSMLHSLLDRIKLEEHARYFNAVISVADAGVIVMDKNHLIVDWNVGAENILGYNANDMIGKTRKHYAPESSFSNIESIERRLANGESIVRVDVERTRKGDDAIIICSASYTPIFDDNGSFNGSVAIFHDITDKKRMELELKEAVALAEERNRTITDSIDYASNIQKNLLPMEYTFDEAFQDYSIIWKPRDIVGGDIYWLKNFSEGSVLCVCDCTGHGTPGALLTMLVVSSLDTIIKEKNYKHTDIILWELEKRLVSVLNSQRKKAVIKDGCDIAVLYISKDGDVTLSSGNTHVFVCDGKTVNQIKGQRLYIGEGRIADKTEIKVLTIPANPDNKFYVASDGLFDQKGGEFNRPFGYNRFKTLILENHSCPQVEISNRIWEVFEDYRGDGIRLDDFEMVSFKPYIIS